MSRRLTRPAKPTLPPRKKSAAGKLTVDIHSYLLSKKWGPLCGGDAKNRKGWSGAAGKSSLRWMSSYFTRETSWRYRRLAVQLGRRKWSVNSTQKVVSTHISLMSTGYKNVVEKMYCSDTKIIVFFGEYLSKNGNVTETQNSIYKAKLKNVLKHCGVYVA